MNDANTGLYSSASDKFSLVSGGTQIAAIVPGNFIFSPTETTAISALSFNEPAYQFLGTSTIFTSTLSGLWANNATGSVNYYYKSRGTSVGANGALIGNEFIVAWQARGDDGTADQGAAEIRMSSDAAASAGKVPGRITFSTGDSSTGTLTERLRIDSTGALQMGGTNTVIGPLRHFQLRSYTVAGLPSAATAGQLIYVSNESGGATPAFSDGTNWRRVADRAIVS
jgi:hypothetical protein